MSKRNGFAAASAIAGLLVLPAGTGAQGRRAPASDATPSADSSTPATATGRQAPSGEAQGTARARSDAPSPPQASSTSSSRSGSATQGSGSGGSRQTNATSAENARNSGNRGVRGYAQTRRGPTPRQLQEYRYVGRPYPWYSSGFGLTLGGSTYRRWSAYPDFWTWYAPVYDPWYRPFGYSYYQPFGYGSRSYDDDRYDDRDNARDDRPAGAIRLRANPRSARVYVDGAFVGVVDDFDGLSHHLSLEPGHYELELRAEGYQRFVTDVTVAEGKTLTTRADLKKVK